MSDDPNQSPSRRNVLIAAATGATLAAMPGCEPDRVPTTAATRRSRVEGRAPSDDAVISIAPLGFQWTTFDPFLFCVHHDDAYPAGNAVQGPAASLAGRNMGQDFELRDGWRMYHGGAVPGFPQHPHRGFETVTVVRRGFVDHSDSLGATARYGAGDTQWLTAGAGIVHAEMFPLVERESPNPLELFQIWLNLPSADKFAAPHFSMLWREGTPTHSARDSNGRRTSVTVIAGSLADARAPAPPPRSWAARSDSDVAIWTVAMEPHARWTLPPAVAGSNRALYFFKGTSLRIGTRSIPARMGMQLRADAAVQLTNGEQATELLMLQGRPIGEPVAQRGPFVMNSNTEIQQAFADYRRTNFGGWPWPSDEPVHPRPAGRFARHTDGREERRG